MSLVTDVRTLIDEVSGGVFWTDQHVYDACNWEVTRAYFDEKGSRRESATITITAASPFVGIPATIAIPHYIIYGEREYWPSSYETLERYDQKWRTASVGQPKAFIVWDHRTFRVWPQADATYEMKVFGIQWPDEIGAANLDVDEDTHFKNMIAFRAASSLLQATLPQQSAMYEQQAKELEWQWNEHRHKFKGTHHFDRLRPGTAFTVKQRGNPNLFKAWS